MGREEQVEEREVLDSIFPDEITDIAENEFRISILLDVVNDDGDESEPPTILFHIKFTENYPDEAPTLDLFSPPDAPRHPYIDVSTDKTHLLSSLDQPIEENLGMQMIFTLQMVLKEAAEDLIRERQAGVRKKEEERILAQEAEENKKFQGTPVNAETFNTWNESFKKEMAAIREQEMLEEAAEEKKRNRGKEAAVGLTGRQLWERGMAGKIDESDDEDGGELPADIGKLKV